MNKSPSNDVKRLPKWAQSLIEDFQRDNERLKAALKGYESNNEGSGVYAETRHDRETLGIPGDAQVVFQLDGARRGEVRIRRSYSGETTDGRPFLTVNGDRSLKLSLQGSNTFRIENAD